MMKEKLGAGKFGHLQSDKTPWHLINKDNYIIVPLQLPHDETIKYHSDFSVEHFVTQLCHMANTWDGPQIVFKGHPVNFGSMAPLKNIIEGGFNNVLYVADANFNELVKNAQAMFVLNGGSGQEAMLHGIPVVCFGRCDYAPAVIQGDIDDPDQAFKTMMYDDHVERIEMYKRWYDWYVNKVVIDVNKT
jgi:capsule polysaccharide modification protein KpsS